MTDFRYSFGRFAPSPTGRMHLGNIWAALFSDLAIHAAGGQQILRIEDLDDQRSSSEYTTQLIKDLKWLNLSADIGMSETSPIKQSERYDLYQEVFAKWQKEGRVYPCTCRRADLMAASAPHAEDGHRVYSGHCRPKDSAARLTAASATSAWRLQVEPKDLAFTDLLAGYQQMNLLSDWGDLIIRRQDGGFAYQLACAVDDLLMKVDLIVRGRDLIRSAFPQRYIFELLGQSPPDFAHVPLLVDQQGYRLSKRQQSLDLGSLQQAGFTAQRLIGYLAWLAGLIDRPEPIDARDLLVDFSLEKIKNRATLTVDPADLYQWL